MYKTTLTQIIIGTVFLSAAAGVHAAGIWKETDVDLPTLITYDFVIVDTSFTLSASMDQSVEVIYMMKDHKLFRCTTLEIKNQEPKHWCETLG
jgi:hypothetical protein